MKSDMSKPEISGIAPFFIVKNVPAALQFYRDRLGFDITFQGPSEDDIFFGIVQRGAAMIILKDVGVDPIPNYTGISNKALHAGTLTCMLKTLMPWRQNLHHATSSFLYH